MERLITRWARIITILVMLTGLVIFLVSIGDLVQLLIISALLAYILDPLVTRIESHGPGRVFSTVIFFAGVSLILGVLLLLLLPFISAELSSLQYGVDVEKAQIFLTRLETLLANRLEFLGIRNLNLAEKLGQAVVDYGNQIITNFLGIVSVITNLVLTPIFVFFLLKDWRDLKKWVISIVPNRYFEVTLNLFYKIDLQMGNYLRGVILDAMIIGILSTFALWLLNVKYFIIIGTFAGLANLIPYVGPLSGAILAIGTALVETGDFTLILYIALAFATIQLIDNAVVQPAVVAKTVNLPPLLLLIVIIIGGKFFGILGMILSVPVTGSIKVSLQEGYRIFSKYRFS